MARPVDSHSGARGNILAGLQTFSRGPSGEKNFEFFLLKWYILAYFLNFWPTAGPPNVAGHGVANPFYPTLSTGLPMAWLVCRLSVCRE